MDPRIDLINGDRLNSMSQVVMLQREKEELQKRVAALESTARTSGLLLPGPVERDDSFAPPRTRFLCDEEEFTHILTENATLKRLNRALRADAGVKNWLADDAARESGEVEDEPIQDAEATGPSPKAEAKPFTVRICHYLDKIDALEQLISSAINVLGTAVHFRLESIYGSQQEALVPVAELARREIEGLRGLLSHHERLRDDQERNERSFGSLVRENAELEYSTAHLDAEKKQVGDALIMTHAGLIMEKAGAAALMAQSGALVETLRMTTSGDGSLGQTVEAFRAQIEVAYSRIAELEGQRNEEGEESARLRRIVEDLERKLRSQQAESQSSRAESRALLGNYKAEIQRLRAQVVGSQLQSIQSSIASGMQNLSSLHSE